MIFEANTGAGKVTPADNAGISLNKSVAHAYIVSLNIMMVWEPNTRAGKVTYVINTGIYLNKSDC